MPGFVLCGEGPTDLYYDAERGNNGPLKICVDKLLELFWGDASYLMYKQISRGELSVTIGKGKPEKKTAYPRGLKKHCPDAVSTYKFAECLAEKTKEYAASIDDDVAGWGAIFFKDLDAPSGTNINEIYGAKKSAMEQGFAAAEFENGVPMIPKTRSESWLLCGLLPNVARENHFFENLPMSDKSPNSGKKVLAKYLGTSEDESYSILESRLNDISWEGIEASSFIEFKEKLKSVSGKMLGYSNQ